MGDTDSVVSSSGTPLLIPKCIYVVFKDKATVVIQSLQTF